MYIRLISNLYQAMPVNPIIIQPSHKESFIDFTQSFIQG